MFATMGFAGIGGNIISFLYEPTYFAQSFAGVKMQQVYICHFDKLIPVLARYEQEMSLSYISFRVL